MSKDSIKVNAYFKAAVKRDVDFIKDNIILTDRQSQIFEMYYLKKQNIDFIADSLYSSRSAVCNELKIIRDRIVKLI